MDFASLLREKAPLGEKVEVEGCVGTFGVVSDCCVREKSAANQEWASGQLVHSDHLDSPKIITDKDEQIVWRTTNQAFGESKPNEDPDGDGNKVTLNVRFPGQYYDQESQLHYNYFRDYDPSVGRYIEWDPIGLDADINVYSYVGNNPLYWIDPRGLFGQGAVGVAPTGNPSGANPQGTSPARPGGKPIPVGCVAKCFAKREVICLPLRLAGASTGATVGAVGSVWSGGVTAPGLMKGGAAAGSQGGRLICEVIMFPESCFEECEDDECD